MFPRFRMEWVLVCGLAVSFTVSPGCALFPGSGMTGGPENADFRRTATTSTNPIPLPVEIVSDISAIASGYGKPQDGVWKPVYPEVDRNPATNSGTDQATGAIPPGTAQITAQITAQEPPATEAAASPMSNSTVIQSRPPRGGKTEEYRVRSGDTLMKISFEKFGNIYRWREIYNRNRENIPNFNSLTAGTVLVIEGVEYVVITRNGVPYLIRRGDTLGRISKKVYGVTNQWRSIWKNNPELIRDPNKIYAGFTLYYEPTKTEPRQAPLPQVTRTDSPPTSVPTEPGAVTAKAPASVVEPTVAPTNAEPVVSQPEVTTPALSPPSESNWVPAE